MIDHLIIPRTRREVSGWFSVSDEISAIPPSTSEPTFGDRVWALRNVIGSQRLHLWSCDWSGVAGGDWCLEYDDIWSSVAHRSAFTHNRCLVPYLGFGIRNHPETIWNADKTCETAAALFNPQSGTASIIVVPAPSGLTRYTNWVPARVRTRDRGAWLNVNVVSPEVLAGRLSPMPGSDITAFSVA